MWRQRDWRAAPLLLLMAGLAACGPDAGFDTGALAADELPRDTVVFGDARAREDSATATARDAREPDRRFLEDLLDHYQGLDYLGARIARSDAGRRTRRQIWRWTTRENPDKRQIAELLRKRFGERYEPTVPPEFKRAADSLAALPPEEQPRALVRLLAHHHQGDVARISATLPELRDSSVRGLAQALRSDQSRELDRLLLRLNGGGKAGGR
ncbi:MAG TPA: hypothetical protein VFK09_13255 [Gemmatimonadales bacterium]|jgi:uncharacterized protein (DUF305 family)|nr:hypothetical protein [Gemmatimonadales bacterium]